MLKQTWERERERKRVWCHRTCIYITQVKQSDINLKTVIVWDEALIGIRRARASTHSYTHTHEYAFIFSCISFDVLQWWFLKCLLLIPHCLSIMWYWQFSNIRCRHTHTHTLWMLRTPYTIWCALNAWALPFLKFNIQHSITHNCFGSVSLSL